MRPILATTVADRKGLLITKAKALAPVVSELFSGISSFATTETHPELVRALDSIGASIVRADSDSGLIGRHRRFALRGALSLGDESHILYMDLDHLLRWIENDEQELRSTLQLIPEWDCLVIGRSPASLRALPRRLAETESIVNHIYYLSTGRSWDLMMSARGFSFAAARDVVEHCTVDSIGNDVAWPLLCDSLQYSLGYAEADGLTYRTNADYATDSADMQDDDPLAWAARVAIASQHVQTMLPYLSESTATSLKPVSDAVPSPSVAE